MELLEFPLDDGTAIIVEVSDDEPGVERAGKGKDRFLEAAADLDKGLEQVEKLAARTVEKVRGLAHRPDAVEIEFGVRLNAEAGAVVARTTVEGHLKVKMSWQALAKQT